MSENIEHVVFENLLGSDEYIRQVLPFLSADYFDTRVDRELFKMIDTFFANHNAAPTKKILKLQIEDSEQFKQEEYTEAIETIDALGEAEVNKEWMLERTEQFCRDKAIFNAITKAISILDGREKEMSKDSIPSMLQEALSIAFDKSVGHDYLGDIEERYDFYHMKQDRIPFHLDILNKVTKGGTPKKTLNAILAGCVHPNTKVKIRIRERMPIMWIEQESTVGALQSLMETYDIEIDSPDGWVPVAEYVDKGEWEEYVLDIGEHKIRCNENHLFETTLGWYSAKDILSLQENHVKKLHILTKDGFSDLYNLSKTGNMIPIVDVVIDHPNHRYWTENVSSHNTNVGKSLFLTDHASGALKMGYNCLYITMEMAEERISERIDCNLMDVRLDDLYRMKKADFVSKLSEVQSKTKGQLVVKEYPTGGAHAGHFRSLLDELKQKKNFVPDVVYIDYLNICASQKYKSNNYSSYFAIKAIAEELRGLAVEYNFCCWTATQANRGGNNNSDIESTDTSESFGTVMTLDFLLAMIRTEELDAIGQLMCKQLKSRYNSTDFYKRFVVGIELEKFKLHDIDNPTADISDAGRHDDGSTTTYKNSTGGINELNFD